MTTNLVELINPMLKKTWNLLISSMVMITYTYYNKFFMERDRKMKIITVVAHIYCEVATKALKDAKCKANIHKVLSFSKKKEKEHTFFYGGNTKSRRGTTTMMVYSMFGQIVV